MIKIIWKKNKNNKNEYIGRGKNGYMCYITCYSYSKNEEEYEFILMFNENSIVEEDNIKTLKKAKEIAERYVYEMSKAFEKD